MSKLIEKLERTSEAEAAPLGFGPARARQKSPSMVLIARLSGPESKALKAVQDTADALLVSVQEWDKSAITQLKHPAKAAGSTPWGVLAASVNVQNLASLIELGCDYVVFGESLTPAAVLDEEKIGKVIEIDPSLPDSHIRVMERLSVGAAMASLGDISPLMVHQALVCRRVAALVRKPLLVGVPAEITTADLQALCRCGVKGLVVDAEVEDIKEKLARLKEAISALPVLKQTSKGKFQAMLPSVPEPATAAPEEPDEGEGDDD